MPSITVIQTIKEKRKERKKERRKERREKDAWLRLKQGGREMEGRIARQMVARRRRERGPQNKSSYA